MKRQDIKLIATKCVVAMYSIPIATIITSATYTYQLGSSMYRNKKKVPSFKQLKDTIIGATSEILPFTISGISKIFSHLTGNPTITLKTEGSNPPLVFVHGYLDSSLSMIPFAENLSEYYNGPIHVIGFQKQLTSIPVIAEEFKEQLKALGLEDTEIIGIGHSMGGLVLNYYNQYLSLNYPLKAILTFGTPWGGTELAHLGIRAAQQMTPDNPFIIELIKEIEYNIKPTQHVHFISDGDNIVVPAKKSVNKLRLDNAEYIFLDGPHGHIGILYSNVIIEKTLKILENLRIKSVYSNSSMSSSESEIISDTSTEVLTESTIQTLSFINPLYGGVSILTHFNTIIEKQPSYTEKTTSIEKEDIKMKINLKRVNNVLSDF